MFWGFLSVVTRPTRTPVVSFTLKESWEGRWFIYVTVVFTIQTLTGQVPLLETYNVASDKKGRIPSFSLIENYQTHSNGLKILFMPKVKKWDNLVNGSLCVTCQVRGSDRWTTPFCHRLHPKRLTTRLTFRSKAVFESVHRVRETRSQKGWHFTCCHTGYIVYLLT